MLLGANLIIAICYFTIAALVGQHLWQVRSRGQNVLGLATFGIFLTCGLGHGVHVLTYLSSSLPSLAATSVIGGFICMVTGAPAWQTAAHPNTTQAFTVFGSDHTSYAWVQLFVDLLTIIPAATFLGLRHRYRLLAEGEAVILDYQQTIQVQHAIVAERTAALETAEAHARELAEARARAEQARSVAEQTALALQASERRFRLLAENARDIIYRYQLGEHPSFEYMSPAVTTVLGYSPDDWYADPLLLARMMHPDDRPLWDLLVCAPYELTNPLVYRCIRRDGTLVWIEQQTAVVEVAGRSAPAIECVARDITERVQAEAAQRKLENKLQEAQRLESIGVLAGGIAHDFNNLLTGILANAELALLDLPNDMVARAGIESIHRAATHAADLTRQMLAYAGKGKYIVQPVNVNSLFHEMKELLHMSVFKRCALTFHLATALPSIEADVAQMRQVIMNLLINAAESIGERDGTIAVSTAVVMLNREQLNETIFGADLQPGWYVQLEVSDTGHGMDAATLDHIFDPFFTTRFTGRGLGLSAVQGILRSHCGTLRVRSVPNQGTTFQIWLPTSTTQPQAAASPRQYLAPNPGSILVIDDEETVRAAARNLLQRCGFTVYAAANGPAGLDMLRELDSLCGVILDLTMPTMAGDAVARAIQALRPGLPIVLMSGYSATEVAHQYADLGIAGFLQKPFTLDMMQGALQHMLERLVS